MTASGASDNRLDKAAIAEAVAAGGHSVERSGLCFPASLPDLIALTSDGGDAPGGAVIAVIADNIDPLDRDLMLAAIKPLARSLAPNRRLGAIHARAGAEAVDIADAALFLGTAMATTGQVISVGKRLSRI